MPQLPVRANKRANAARWERLVGAGPGARSFHRVGRRGGRERRFGHRARYLLAERAGEIAGVLPLAEVKSLLFGHALVSLPFCAVAGVAAFDAEAAPALHPAARTLGERRGAGPGGAPSDPEPAQPRPRAARPRGERTGAQPLELRNPAPREPTWPRQD